MQNNRTQFLVFTGFDGSMIDPESLEFEKVLPALHLLRSQKIPLIPITYRTAAEILPTLEIIDHQGPFIVESGGAIYIPNNSLTIPFSYKKSFRNYKVVELGITRVTILEMIAKLRQQYGFKITGFSEISPEQLPEIGEVTVQQIQAAQSREYSEPIIFRGTADELGRLQDEVENHNLRLNRRNGALMLTGDHDEGSAVLYLTQLYREECPGRSVVSIGLGDSLLDAPMLYEVDLPVLVRKPNGRFDDRVGRRNLKFTRDPGPVGWNMAVTALVTCDSAT